MSDFARQFIQENLPSAGDELHEPAGSYLDFIEAVRALGLKYDAEDKEDRTYLTIYNQEDEGQHLRLVFG
ncbi:MAG: hypothetical protein ACFB4J_12360 [Elainellaceae cyanobacterium]